MIRTTATHYLLLACQFVLAAAALTIHLRVHSPFNSHGPGELSFTNSVASLLSLIDLVGVTFLFSRKKTAAWGYLLNGLITIYGTVLMVHWGWVHFYSFGVPFIAHFSGSTTLAVVITWGDFLLGAALFRLWFDKPKERTGQALEASA